MTGDLHILRQHVLLSARLYQNYGAALAATWMAGTLFGMLLMMLAVEIGFANRLAGLIALVPVVLLQLVVFVAMFVILRDGFPPASTQVVDVAVRPVDWPPVFRPGLWFKFLFRYALLPLVWFNLGAIVYGHDLKCTKVRSRRYWNAHAMQASSFPLLRTGHKNWHRETWLRLNAGPTQRPPSRVPWPHSGGPDAANRGSGRLPGQHRTRRGIPPVGAGRITRWNRATVSGELRSPRPVAAVHTPRAFIIASGRSDNEQRYAAKPDGY